MTVIRDDVGKVRIEGVSHVEDAEPLSAAMLAQPLPDVDLSACEGLHAAVLQTLLVFRPPLSGLSDNPHLAWLAPILEKKPPTGETLTRQAPPVGL